MKKKTITPGAIFRGEYASKEGRDVKGGVAIIGANLEICYLSECSLRLHRADHIYDIMDLRIVKDDIFIYDGISDHTLLREDMYQAVCGRYIIDCGWYQNDDGGSFTIYIIKDQNWEVPVIKTIVRTHRDAKWAINICKEYISEV